MERRTPIFIVASPRPRNGKTLLARALIEFFVAQNRQVAAFDVNPDEFKLVDFLPGYAAVASIEDTRGQMALFDQLVVPDQVPKIIDLGHNQFDKFFSLAQQIDFSAEVRRNGLAPMVLFLADPDQRARQGFAMLANRFFDLPVTAVINLLVPQIMRSREHFPATRLGGAPVTIPALAPVIRTVIDRPGFSFISYLSKNPDKTSELYNWARDVFIIFRELELRLTLGELSSQQRHFA